MSRLQSNAGESSAAGSSSALLSSHKSDPGLVGNPISLTQQVRPLLPVEPAKQPVCLHFMNQLCSGHPFQDGKEH